MVISWYCAVAGGSLVFWLELPVEREEGLIRTKLARNKVLTNLPLISAAVVADEPVASVPSVAGELSVANGLEPVEREKD